MWNAASASHCDTRTQQPVHEKVDVQPHPVEQQHQEGDTLEERQLQEGEEQMDIKDEQQMENKFESEVCIKIPQQHTNEKSNQNSELQKSTTHAFPTVDDLRELAHQGEEALCSDQLLAQLRSCCRRLRAEQKLRPMLAELAVPNRAVTE